MAAAAQRVSAEEVSRWPVVYPAYLNGALTEAQGRRVGKALCVPNPTLQELAMVLQALGYRFVMEDKYYSRDPVTQRGRVRVELFKPPTRAEREAAAAAAAGGGADDDKPPRGKPAVEGVASKKALLRAVAQKIPLLKTRAPAAAASGGSGGGSGGGSSKKNKNKKKKRK